MLGCWLLALTVNKGFLPSRVFSITQQVIRCLVFYRVYSSTLTEVSIWLPVCGRAALLYFGYISVWILIGSLLLLFVYVLKPLLCAVAIWYIVLKIC